MIIRRITLIRVLCCLGCFTQTFHLTQLYFSYSVQNGVTFFYPNEMTLPEIDIAIPIVSLLNMTAIFSLYPRLIQILCYEIRIQEDEYLNETLITDRRCEHLRKTRLILSSIMEQVLTVGDIERYSVDPVPMIHNIHYRDLKIENRLPIGKGEICEIKRFFSAHRVYLRISCSNDSQPIKAYQQNLLANGDFLASISHGFNFPIEVRLAAPKTSIKTRSGFYNPIDVYAGQFARTYVKFRKTTIHLLEPPYQTKCRHYSRFKSYDSCLKDLYLAAKYSNGSSNPTLHQASLHEFGVYPSNLRFIGLDKKTQYLIHSKCQKAVQQSQCDTTEYQIKVKTFVDEIGPDGGLILFSPSTEPDVLFASCPYMEKSEYITFTGSILSFWFGFSVSNRLFWSLNLFKTFKDKSQTANVPKAKRDKLLFSRRTSYNSNRYRQTWNMKPEN